MILELSFLNTPKISRNIIDREIKADIIFENGNIIAFNDVNPVAPIHILIVPKKLIESINSIKEEDSKLIGEMFLVAKELAKKLKIARLAGE